MPRTVRSIQRVQTIARVLSHHGFGFLVQNLHLDRYVPLPKRWRRLPAKPAADPEQALGRRLVQVCKELGPTFIKLGQMLSTRPDLIPPDIIKELITLQDQVPPFDTAVARRMIAADLGITVEEGYASFESRPFASGSIAQVYRATIKDVGEQSARRVVVKVKRPDIEDVVRLDMTILRWIAELAERMMPDAIPFQPRMIVDEFEAKLLREMDFINEAATISHFSEAYGPDPYFRAPQVYWELTGPGVLTLEEIEGTSMQKILATDDPSIDRPLLARRLMQAFIRQFFEIGLFHADPHPGNLLIEAPARIGIIDFGLTGRIDDVLLGHLVIALAGALNREPEVIVEVLADMNALGEATDRAQLRREFMEAIEKYYGLPLERFDMQAMYYEVNNLIRRNDVTLPREFVLFGKALICIGGISLQLDPKLDLVALVKPKLRTLIMERLTPARMAKSALISGWHMINILKSAPGLLRDISRRMARGKWQVNIRHQNLDYLANEIDRASNRLGFSVIIGAVIVGSSWVVSSGNNTPVFGLPIQALGMIGYLVAGIMGIWLLIAFLRSGRLS
ncbi:MAG: AarF/ABC1/UbiB kinase family protein [Phycisphaerales bacterium]|nr:AarF/ABC1/UbiB kinase family protein [Phycisphaerales bacterium]